MTHVYDKLRTTWVFGNVICYIVIDTFVSKYVLLGWFLWVCHVYMLCMVILNDNYIISKKNNVMKC
jgi:hypothetical protein